MAYGSNDAGLHWLVLLHNFSHIHTWDWGGLVLAVLYELMDSFSCRTSPTHQGMCMLWEV